MISNRFKPYLTHSPSKQGAHITVKRMREESQKPGLTATELNHLMECDSCRLKLIRRDSKKVKSPAQKMFSYIEPLMVLAVASLRKNGDRRLVTMITVVQGYSLLHEISPLNLNFQRELHKGAKQLIDVMESLDEEAELVPFAVNPQRYMRETTLNGESEGAENVSARTSAKSRTIQAWR
jgi:hypothetical protein